MTRQASFRIEGPGGQEIETLEQWLEYAPPKKREGHWEPGRSAMENARAWLNDGSRPTLPHEIRELLDSDPATSGFHPTLAIAEWVTKLDEYRGEHRNHDLIAIGVAAGRKTLLAVEAKADESFGNHTVDQYLKV